MFYKKWLVNFTSLNCNLKNGPKLSHFGRAKLRRSKNGSVSAEQPCCRPNQAIFPLNIDSGFIVNAPVTSNTAALSIYTLWLEIGKLATQGIPRGVHVDYGLIVDAGSM